MTLSEHFGRSREFLVFEVEEQRILSKESRVNLPHEEHSHASSDAAGDHQKHHSGMAALLHDCRLVLCGGMGWRAAEALQNGGITPVMIGVTGPADQIVCSYIAGALDSSGKGFCGCHR